MERESAMKEAMRAHACESDRGQFLGVDDAEEDDDDNFDRGGGGTCGG